MTKYSPVRKSVGCNQKDEHYQVIWGRPGDHDCVVNNHHRSLTVKSKLSYKLWDNKILQCKHIITYCLTRITKQYM